MAAARTEASDAIERAMTSDGATVLLRDKHVARAAAALMIPGALVFLLAAVAVLLGADPAAPRAAALLPFGLFAAMVYGAVANMVVRCAVTERELRVQWGLRRQSIPLAAISACEARGTTGAPTLASGGGWSIFASHGAVFVRWTEGARTRELLLPANDPETLARVIERARAAPTRLRVDAEEPATADPAERETPAEAASGRARG